MLWKLVASWEKIDCPGQAQPHAHYLDGPMLEDGYQSFIGMHHVPTVYIGMTIGIW